MRPWSAPSRRRTVVASALFLLLLAAPLLGNSYYTSLMIVVAIHTILTVGLCLLMGYAGQVSLGHAAFYGLGAFFSAILSATYGLNPWLAMGIAAAATGVIAYLLAFPIFHLRGNYLAMATLGFGIIVYILFVELKEFTGGPSGLPGIPALAVGPLELDTDLKFYYLAWAFCLGTLLISQNIVNSRVGRALRAIHGSEAAARSLGIDVSRFKMKVFVLSAVYASIAGSLYAHYTTFVSPQPFGFLFSVRLVVMAVVGGLASIWGAIFGTVTITLLGDLLQGFGEMDTVVFGLILILVMVFLPKGLFRGLVDLYEGGQAASGRGWREWASGGVGEWVRRVRGRKEGKGGKERKEGRSRLQPVRGDGDTTATRLATFNRTEGSSLEDAVRDTSGDESDPNRLKPRPPQDSSRISGSSPQSSVLSPQSYTQHSSEERP